MNTVSTITSIVAPILQHPLFKVGCYVIAILTIIILSYFFIKSRKKTRAALKDKEIISESHPWTTAVAIIFVFSLSFGILANIMDWNRPGKITVLDNGSVITDSKLYFSLGSNTAAVYDQSQTIIPSITPEKEEPVKLKFKDFGFAETDYELKMDLPPEPEKIKKIHKCYGNQEKLVSEGVKPFIAEALKISAILLSAHESSAEKEKKLYAYVKDQLEKGHYVVEEGKIKTDEKGMAIRKKNPLSQFKIKLSKFKFENFQYDKLLKKLDTEKDKLILEFKHIEVLDFKNMSFLDGIQQEIDKHILGSKKLSKHQKKLIVESVDNIKQLIKNLKERDNKSKDSKPD
ncbi:MAG: hypothetical protein KAT17_10770 [Candidatus Aminicenantes bacterium]|nr:hypothetical protein [Candidatus Aminicenantes bacterium]